MHAHSNGPRFHAVRLAALLLAFCLLALPASAAGGAGDSLVTESYVDAWADGLLEEATASIDEAFGGIQAGEPEAGSRVISLTSGDVLTLEPGASFVLLSGSARVRVGAAAVVNATVGARAVTGNVNPEQLYIVSGAQAEVTALGAVRAVVWGSSSLMERSVAFTDVPEGSWYYDYVYAAVDAGLVDGVTETTFEPESGFTVAQAIKIAACLHQHYHTGAVTLTNGETWYDTYVDYAVANGICDALYATMSWDEMNSAIDRRDFAVIFYNAMPESEYEVINSIGAVPDVATTDEGAQEIYALYRAGILDGALDDGSYLPDSGIRRCEAAAIVARMLDETLRVHTTLG